MEKERLSIGIKKVAVEYEFLNESDEDITTEVAFPVPPYEYLFDNTGGPREFGDFKLWVNDEPVNYSTIARAVVKGKDFSPLLRRLRIDFIEFGHFDPDDAKLAKYDVSRLSKQNKDDLIRLGLISADDSKPLWAVEKTYHWSQSFPAHKILKVRHEYSPAWGWFDMPIQNLESLAKTTTSEKLKSESLSNPEEDPLRSACPDTSLPDRVKDDQRLFGAKHKDDPSSEFFLTFWVDYILTTANNWKKPIKEFEVVVERPESFVSSSKKWYVTFCWDGVVERPDDHHFVARAKNFVPSRELRVAFLGTQTP